MAALIPARPLRDQNSPITSQHDPFNKPPQSEIKINNHESKRKAQKLASRLNKLLDNLTKTGVGFTGDANLSISDRIFF